MLDPTLKIPSLHFEHRLTKNDSALAEAPATRTIC
jgi:hypothetical protein